MSEIVKFGDLVDKNGKTIRENNAAKEHKIPINSLVDVNIEEYYGDGAGMAGKARLYVFAHTRDCDGTPLYTLSETPFQERFAWSGVGPGLNVRVEMGAPVFSYGRLLLESFFRTKRGYSEKALKVVEITPAVLSGEGVPTLEDGK